MKNFGFKESVIEDSHYLQGDGALATDVIFSDGHGWAGFLPPDQFQNQRGIETYNCTSEGTLHALAALGNKKFGASFQKNLSPRYLGIMANTGINGNDPHYVCEVLRTRAGVVPDVFLPFPPSILNIQGYYAPKPITYSLFATGQHWMKKYTAGHEWCFLPGDSLAVKQLKMKQALQYSPLGVSGFAWSQHADGKYYSDQPMKNHWFTVYDFSEGEFWSAFDSYDQTHKLLDWSYDFGQAKRFHLDLANASLGDVPEQVYPQFAMYLIGEYVKSIFS